MILIARGGSTRTQLERKTKSIIRNLRKKGLAQILAVERGDGIHNKNGDDIEHFGYVDGISQPAFFKEEIG